MEYPKAITSRSGNKVGWLYYKTKKDAIAASKLAVIEAEHKSALGYDFGYLWPGSIRQTFVDGKKLWEVVIP
jgi:hypothetical protein